MSVNFIEYCELNIAESDDRSEISTYVLGYINNLDTDDFDRRQILRLSAVSEKYCAMLEFLNLDHLIIDLTSTISNLQASVYDANSNGKNPKYQREVTDFYQELIARVVSINNKIQKSENIGPWEPFKSLYSPNYYCDKVKASELIRDAIDLIRSDKHLSLKYKRQIVDQLESILRDLTKPKPNWRNFFGNTKEIIIILGAIGSLASGLQATNLFMESKSKIEEAVKIIETTSIKDNSIDSSLLLEENELKTIPQNSSNYEGF